MKKIFFINSTLNTGGAEKMLYELVKHLDPSEFSIKVCCLYKPGAIGGALIQEGVDLRHGLMKGKRDLIGVYKLFRLLREERPDLLCLASSPLTLFWGFVCGRILKVASIVTVIHTMLKPDRWVRFKSGFVNRLVLSRLDGIGVVSRRKLDSLVKEYGLRPDKVTLIHNGVDIDRFKAPVDKNGLRRKLGVTKEEKIIGMVGRLVREKAYDVFLESAKRILAHVPEGRFLIVGEGEERPGLKRLAGELGIEKRVIFLGERKDIPEIVSLFDVAVLSSRVESFPVALLEYMASSKPIVATDVGGNPELILNGETGFIVPVEDPKAFSEKVMELLSDTKKAETMGEKARDLAEKYFSADRMSEKMEKFFMSSFSGQVQCEEKPRVLMMGPRFDVKGGVSSFARYCIESELSVKFDLGYIPTTIDGNIILKSFYFIRCLTLYLIRLVWERHIRIVHIYTSSRGSFYRKAIILLMAKVFRKRTIFHIEAGSFDVFYDTGHSLRRFSVRRILDLSDSIVVLSNTWLSEMSRMTSNRNIKVIPNSVDTLLLKRMALKRDSSLMNVLTLGRLGWRKGTYDILDTIPLVIKELPEAKFYLAGDGDLGGVKRICEKKGIDKNVVISGWLRGEKLLKALENASIFLLPSYHEGLPVAIVEAMASGLPIVSTRVGGIPEAVKENVNGLLIEPGQKEKLARNIITLLKDKELREKMGRNNIKRMETDFSIKRIIEKLSSEYEFLLKDDAGLLGNRLIWYAKRLSRMSIREVTHRIYKFIRLNMSRFSIGPVRIDRLLRRDAGKRYFYFNPGDYKQIREEILSLSPERIKEIIAEADILRAHKFRIFSMDWIAPQLIDWHKDILTGRRWPLKYWADIDFRNNHDIKEVRLVWELNRHQHLLTLGKAYLLTQNIGYAEEIKEQIFSWIRQNPLYIGINWASPLEVSLRLISWCWAYKFIEESNVLPEIEKKEFLTAIYNQTEFISRNLSRYSSGNNHLIGEACGLIITAISFPEFKKSQDWLDKGKRILFEEIIKQVHPDGVTKEQAFHYQAFIMELFIITARLFMKNDIEIPKAVMDRFSSMSEFIMNIMDKSGNIPHIGDSDDGRALRLSERGDFNVFRSILSSASIISGREDFKDKGCSFQEEHYWLFGIEGLKKYRAIADIDLELDSRFFEKGGYAVLRKKSKVFIMDCGELGYSSIAAHGHADLFSVTLSVDGVEFLIDPGTYLYHAGNRWRDYFRGTTAHNTVSVNNKNQSEITGPFMWGRRVMPEIQKWMSSGETDYISASYANCAVMHKRSVLFDKISEIWSVEDVLRVKGENKISQYFHLPSTASVDQLAFNMIRVRNQELFLYVVLDKAFSIEVRKGELSPIMGWSSSVFGEKTQSPVLIATAGIKDKGRFVTLLYASGESMDINDLKYIFKTGMVCKC
ncbi:MAG: glycosyltransferase [Candidatus Omnitrophica bacterium]|nr:glycosyltransferase [Candidatus Omnitrophota bacterium]